jgi:hypothetical protein
MLAWDGRVADGGPQNDNGKGATAMWLTGRTGTGCEQERC